MIDSGFGRGAGIFRLATWLSRPVQRHVARKLAAGLRQGGARFEPCPVGSLPEEGRSLDAWVIRYAFGQGRELAIDLLEGFAEEADVRAALCQLDMRLQSWKASDPIPVFEPWLSPVVANMLRIVWGARESLLSLDLQRPQRLRLDGAAVNVVELLEAHIQTTPDELGRAMKSVILQLAQVLDHLLERGQPQD